MFSLFFNTLDIIDNFFWSYIGFAIICISGIYLTIFSRGFQFKSLINFKRNIKDLSLECRSTDNSGIHPFKIYFASVGGMIGIGNIVGVGSAVFIGGPGSIVWMVVASFCGMLLKYCDVYLGIKYRVHEHGAYNGGPMYYARVAWNNRFIGSFIAICLCIYGIEIYQFAVIAERIEHVSGWSHGLVVLVMLMAVMYSTIGGVRRLTNICSIVMPLFLVVYVLICLYIIFSHYNELPRIMAMVWRSAFSGSSVVGGFVGSTFMQAVHMGLSRAIYSGDIGIGYDAIIGSESKVIDPKKQATLSIYGLLTDTSICLLSALTIIVSGAWYTMNDIEPSGVMAKIFAGYLPYSEIFMMVLIFVTGFTTIIGYMTMGVKCARFLSSKYGRGVYFCCALFMFPFFSYFDQNELIKIMSVCSGVLVLVNVCSILKLRKKVEF